MINVQEQSFSGQLRQYLFNREGEIDGLLLDDGTQVHFPPHLGVQLAAIVQPNAAVTVQGQRQNANVIVAFAITNQSTGQTVVDGGPPAPPPPGMPHPPAPHLRHPAPPHRGVFVSAAPPPPPGALMPPAPPAALPPAPPHAFRL